MGRITILVLKYSTFLFCLIYLNVYSQSTWQKSFGSPYIDYPHQMIALSQGGYLLVGNFAPPQFYMGSFLVKTKSNGDSVWSKFISPLDTDKSIGIRSVYEINNNSYLIGGGGSKSFNPNVSYGVLMNLDSNGNILWYRKFDTFQFFNILDFINSSVIFSSPSVIGRIDTSGVLLWSKGTVTNRSNVIKNQHGNYCYLYASAGGTSFREITSNGQIVKDQLFGIGSNVWNGILMQNSRKEYVEVHRGTNTVMVKFDTLLNILSEKTYSGFNELNAFSETPDKGYILTGMENQDIAFLKIDSSGNQEYFHWLVRWFYEEFSVDIHVDTDGGFVVFGSGGRDEPNYTDYLLVKTNSDATLGIPLMPERKHYELIVYPNPSQSVINIKTTFPITGELIITDLIGRTILKKEVHSLSTMELNVESLEQGVYVVQITDQYSHIPFYQKIIKQ